jgi:hypothetical protein
MTVIRNSIRFIGFFSSYLIRQTRTPSSKARVVNFLFSIDFRDLRALLITRFARFVASFLSEQGMKKESPISMELKGYFLSRGLPRPSLGIGRFFSISYI